MSGENGLLAGYAKIDITPDYQVGLGGYGNAEARRHTDVADRVYATCIALTDGDETILLYTLDNCACDHGFAEDIRAEVTIATGVPGEKVFCSATHTHSAPALYGYPEGEQYRKDVVAACVAGAQQALADRKPSRIFAAKKEFPGMNFVRHYKMADGTYAGSNFGTFKDNLPVDYAAKPDSQMVLVKFVREGSCKDILLVNWQGHPDCAKAAGFENITSGYPGTLRDVLGAITGDLVAFFTGADGNTNVVTRIQEDKLGLNWREYGAKMAQLAYEALPELKEVEGAGIATRRTMLPVEINHSWDNMLEQANEVYDLWKTVGKTEANALGKTYGFTSCYQASAIRSRVQMGKTKDLELNAFRVGGVGFTTGTYEMFSEAGTYIKENSPYEFTFLLTGNSGYIPSDAAFNYRCYEADTSHYARGTAEKLANEYIRLLKEVQ